MTMNRSWVLPLAVMALATLALDAVLRLTDAGAEVWIVALIALASACGAYIGIRVASEDDAAPSGARARRMRRIS